MQQNTNKRPRHRAAVKLQDTRTIQSQTTYWEHLMSQAHEDGEALESRQANPDQVSEAAGMYYVSPEQAERNEAIRTLLCEAPDLLTEKQYEVFVKMLRFNSLAQVAQNLGRSKQTVAETFTAVKKKLQSRLKVLLES